MHLTPLGIGATVNIPLGEKLGIQPELVYLMPVRELFTYHMISLPVLLTYQATESVVIEAGPSLERDFSTFNYKEYNSYHQPYYNLGANLGVQVGLTDNWSLGLRYTYEVFRTTYGSGGFTSTDNYDPLINPPMGRYPGWQDTIIAVSIKYKLK